MRGLSEYLEFSRLAGILRSSADDEGGGTRTGWPPRLAGLRGDRIQLGDDLRREFDGGGLDVFLEMRHRGGAGNEQHIRGALEEPGEGPTCIGVLPSASAAACRAEICSGSNPPSGKKGT